MGDLNVEQSSDESRHQVFMKCLLNEIRALEVMLGNGMIESGVRRIGAEQEMFIVDHAFGPANKVREILDQLDRSHFTYELGQFNLEANLSPQSLQGDCLSRMEQELTTLYRQAGAAARKVGCDIALVGILPTLRMQHLGLDSMVPLARYRALNDAMRALRGEEFQLSIEGIDELSIKHDNVMLEACNTSFQVHFQVGPEEFARLYNIAQLITAPLLAVAVNSPILLGKRLWHETRIAVLENSVDARSAIHQARGQQPRVQFGNRWIEESVTEIFKEDLMRNRIIMTAETDSDPLAMIERGEVPSLHALRLHNGTVYRWNRPCYGIMDGKAHLRIENRVMPSGPTIADEMANAAFFFGMMAGMAAAGSDVREHMRFEDAKTNFLAAAREGIRAQMNWFDDAYLPVQQLVDQQLLPLAREGLTEMRIDGNDIDRFLGIIAERVRLRRTGSRWALESLENMHTKGTPEQRMRSLVSSLVEQQAKGDPISKWALAEYCEAQDWRESYRQVSQFMSTDLFTVREDDIVDFAATLMDWRHVRNVPVEDDAGRLIGLVSHRALLRLVATGKLSGDRKVTVGEVMNRNPISVTPDTDTVTVIRLMRENRLGCLPVLQDGKLVGIVTEHDLITVSSRLLESYLGQQG